MEHLKVSGDVRAKIMEVLDLPRSALGSSSREGQFQWFDAFTFPAILFGPETVSFFLRVEDNWNEEPIKIG